ncbi:MAG: DNA polymerase III subunit beta [Chloroflexota bacterium]
MDLTCEQEQFQRALALVSRAVAAKTSMPVLSNVLLTAEHDALRIAATNLEIGISTAIAVAVAEPGQVTVDARLLGEFVATLPAGNVRLRSQPAKFSLNVQSGEGRRATTADINGMDPDDFPVLQPETGGGFAATVDPAAHREIIAQVEFAAAADESRPVLAGVLARFEESRLTLATADGFRLAVRSGPLAEPAPEKLDAIVPARAMRELARIIADATEPVRLALTPNRSQLVVRVDGTVFLSRLIEGTFPDYRAIVPREFATTVTIGRDALQTAVRRSSYFARDNNDVIRLTVAGAEDDGDLGSVEVSANAAERGSSQSFVDAGVSGPGMQIAFNARFLTEVLGVLRSGQVMLGFNGSNQAGVVRPADGGDYDHVIMPMVIGAN